MIRHALGAILVSSSLFMVACGGGGAGTGDEADLTKGTNDQWVYNGPLPHLEAPSVVVSQSAHTARVTGLLPVGFDRTTLPFYVDTVDEAGRVRVAIVYPIATGESFNAQPKEYTTQTIVPWQPTNAHATWGGFPFMSYSGGVAFHGPITSEDGQWHLLRGPVSHGCNRMQGEHVVELAHLFGIDMTTKLYNGQVLHDVHVPVKVIRTADTWKGHLVDVDYPTLPGVVRPTGDVMMFKTWDSNDYAAVVCSVDRKMIKGKTIPATHCADRGLKNARDLHAGPPVHPPVAAPGAGSGAL